MTIIVLRTTAEHIKGVIDNQKHALDRPMQRAQIGDLLLVAEMQPKGPAIARYAMRLKGQHPDDANESDAIWGRHWNFIVEGEDGRELTTPFAPAEVKPNGPYGQGGPYVYVRPEDADDFRRDGRLAPLF
jgi:5-methylcytosine-specific restriction protein A